jgi:hypothetical protein
LEATVSTACCGAVCVISLAASQFENGDSDLANEIRPTARILTKHRQEHLFIQKRILPLILHLNEKLPNEKASFW